MISLHLPDGADFDGSPNALQPFFRWLAGRRDACTAGLTGYKLYAKPDGGAARLSARRMKSTHLVADDVHFDHHAPCVPGSLVDLLALLRRGFLGDLDPDEHHRHTLLLCLLLLVAHQDDTFIDVLGRDFLHQRADELWMPDTIVSVSPITYTRTLLGAWMTPSKRSVALPIQAAVIRLLYHPLGVVSVIVPCNYPLFLAIAPLTDALAPGNSGDDPKKFQRLSRDTFWGGRSFHQFFWPGCGNQVNSTPIRRFWESNYQFPGLSFINGGN